MTATLTIDTLRLSSGPHQALNHAIRALADRGQNAPCYGDPRMLSEKRHEREQAAQDICTACPIRRECSESGRGETFGVWGGKDRTPAHPTKKYRPWTAAEDAVLRTCRTSGEAQKALNRHRSSIQSRARLIGHKFNSTYTPWTDEEENKLRACTTIEEAMDALQGRTRGSIIKRAHSIGHRFGRRYGWTDTDDRLLVTSVSAGEASERVGRSVAAVRARARVIGHSFVAARRAREQKDAA